MQLNRIAVTLMFWVGCVLSFSSLAFTQEKIAGLDAKDTSGGPIFDVTYTLDLPSLEAETKEFLLRPDKHETLHKLRLFLASDVPQSQKNRAAVRLAEMMLYTQEALPPIEDLLFKLKSLTINDDFALQGEVEYLFGLLNYIKSQIHTRSLDTEKQQLIQSGVGSQENDPFIEKALEHFSLALELGQGEAVQKARIAINAHVNPTSFDGFKFYYAMGRLLGDNARLDTLAVAPQYLQVVASYENGEVAQILRNNRRSIKERVDIYTGLSLSYYTLGLFEKSLEVNQKGLDQFGEIGVAVDLKFNRGMVYRYLQRYKEMEKEYDDIIERFPVSIELKHEARLREGKALLRDKERKEKAKTRLTEVLDDPYAKAEQKDIARRLLEPIR